MAARISRRALVSLVAAALLVAPAVRAQTPVEISFWSWVPGIAEHVDAFNASQSDIHVTYVGDKGNGNTEYANLKTALEAGTGIPDVVQIEFQHLPSFIARNELLNLGDHGAAEIADQFVPWTLAQVSQGDAVYAYPQDAGPMIMMCNQAALDTLGVTAPTTWEEFEAAAAAVQAADSTKYLANFTADQGHWFGLLWQSGAHPFAVDGTNLTVSLTSPEATRVAELWDRMRTAGVLAPVDTYSSDWTTALANGTIACWTSGAWGPEVIKPAAPDLSGDWTAYLMPQWEAGGAVNGNYGGSTIAVMAATPHPAEAEAFNRWLNTDPAPTLGLANGPAGLFPVTTATLTNPEWSEYTDEFFGGQKLHELTAEAASQVDTSFQWSPITDYVYQTWAAELPNVASGQSTLVQAMQNLQDQTIQYATDQGFTVTGS
jgi:multiple sugar transport system substrate-binding protein